MPQPTDPAETPDLAYEILRRMANLSNLNEGQKSSLTVSFAAAADRIRHCKSYDAQSQTELRALVDNPAAPSTMRCAAVGLIGELAQRAENPGESLTYLRGAWSKASSSSELETSLGNAIKKVTDSQVEKISELASSLRSPPQSGKLVI
jgi:hypothetical protein